jgi:hypothetical protein
VIKVVKKLTEMKFYDRLIKIMYEIKDDKIGNASL